MHPQIASLLSHPSVRAAMERYLASQGRGGDTNIVHVNPQEMALLKSAGGAGTVNPHTGLPEFYAGGPGSDGNGGSVGGADQGGMGAHPGSDGPRGGGGNVGGHVGGSGAEHNGQGGFITQPGQPTPQPPAQPAVQPPPGIAIAAAPPVTLAPQMSSTATTNLTGGRFGALPAWDLKPYNIGNAPTSYPVPGIDQPPPTTGGGGGAVPPPVTGGSGANGGQGGGGGGFNGGGVPGSGGGSQVGGGQVSPQQFWQVLQQHGIGNGTPNYQQVGQPSPGAPAVNPSQIALQKLFGVGQPPAPAPSPPPAPTANPSQVALQKLLGAGQQPMLGGQPAKPVAQPKPGIFPTLGGGQKPKPTGKLSRNR